MERIERLLEQLERMCGLTILWKYVGMGKTSCGLSEKHTYHSCEFCRDVKADKERLHLCSVNDDILLPRRAEVERTPFINTCHAGVSELAVPLFDGDRCTEVFLAGIFRTPDAGLPDLPGVRSVDMEKLNRVQGVLEELSVILRDRRDSVLRDRNRANEIQDVRIQHAVEYIGKNFSRRISVRELSVRACLSESRFLHLFRKETGLSVIACLTECRLKAARQMLEISGVTIQEVMEKCGFRDQSRFGKLFREHTGCSPLVYHKKFRRRKDV